MSNLNLPVKENITISEITQQRSAMSTPLGDTHTLEFLDQHHVNRELGVRDEEIVTSVNETLTPGDISNEIGNTASPLSKETEFTEEHADETKVEDIIEKDIMVAEELKHTSKPDEAAADEEEVYEARQETIQTDATEAGDKDAVAEAEPNMPMPLMAEFEGEQVPVGDYLKMQYVKHRVLPACLVSPSNGHLEFVELREPYSNCAIILCT